MGKRMLWIVGEERSQARVPLVLYGITIGKSARSLLRGQLSWLRESGWRVELATSPDEDAQFARKREVVVFHPIAMSRQISPMADLRALSQWLNLVRRLRPDVINVSTPKAGLLGGLALREGFPNVVLEAAAAGLLTITTRKEQRA